MAEDTQGDEIKNLKVDSRVHREIKTEAARSEKDMQSLVAEMWECYQKQQAESIVKKSIEKGQENYGLPVPEVRYDVVTRLDAIEQTLYKILQEFHPESALPSDPISDPTSGGDVVRRITDPIARTIKHLEADLARATGLINEAIDPNKICTITRKHALGQGQQPATGEPARSDKPRASSRLALGGMGKK